MSAKGNSIVSEELVWSESDSGQGELCGKNFIVWKINSREMSNRQKERRYLRWLMYCHDVPLILLGTKWKE